MCRKQTLLIFLGFFLLSPAFLSAQTAAQLEAVLETQTVSCAQAAEFILAASGTASPQTGFEQAMANRWFCKGTTPDESITLGKLSFLMMKAFGIKGGLLYTIFPGPRYAFRSMVSRSYIPGSSDPAMKVSGERFLLILGRVLNAVGEEL